jgi:hypothetical protein
MSKKMFKFENVKMYVKRTEASNFVMVTDTGNGEPLIFSNENSLKVILFGAFDICKKFDLDFDKQVFIPVRCICPEMLEAVTELTGGNPQ